MPKLQIWPGAGSDLFTLSGNCGSADAERDLSGTSFSFTNPIFDGRETSSRPEGNTAIQLNEAPRHQNLKRESNKHSATHEHLPLEPMVLGSVEAKESESVESEFSM